jgi:hypothetical protein
MKPYLIDFEIENFEEKLKYKREGQTPGNSRFKIFHPDDYFE